MIDELIRGSLNQIDRRFRGMQVVVLCGRRKKTYDAIQRWADGASSTRVHVLPYCEEMPLLLRSVSAVLTRPGSATSSEAILSECPLLLNGMGGVMPQERLTVNFALKHQIARFITKPDELPQVLDEWQDGSSELTGIAARMKAIRPTQHPRGILDAMARL